MPTVPFPRAQGYCVWDGDKEYTDDDDDDDDSSSSSSSSSSDSQDYSNWESSNYIFMQAMRNELPSGCTQVGDLTYGSESNYYIAIKPLPEGKQRRQVRNVWDGLSLIGGPRTIIGGPRERIFRQKPTKTTLKTRNKYRGPSTNHSR